jgi:putative ABC transport system permease protein
MMRDRLQRRLRALFRRRDMEREMDEEVRFHVEMEAGELVRTAGLSGAEARRRALVAFGGDDRVREAARTVYGVRWVEDLIQDTRQALRLMRRAPSFTVVTVLTLALGIGATTAIFSVVDGALLKPLPYPESDRLVSVWSRFLPESGFDFPQFPLSPPEYADYRVHTQTMDGVAAYHGYRATVIQSDGTALPTRGVAATTNLFDVLRVRPALGRTPRESEAASGPGGAGVVVLGHALWRRAFGGDSSVVGRVIRINGRAAEVIGVMPDGFAYPTDETELWSPLGIEQEQQLNRSAHFLAAVGRLGEGADIDRARAEMDALMVQWKAEYPDVHTGHFLFMQPLIDDTVAEARPALLMLLGAVGFVLLIVCTNVINLLLARSEARRRELAVRRAIGANRLRLVRQFLVEGAVLSLVGGLAGVALAYLAINVTHALGAESIPRAGNIAVDGRVLLFSSGVAFFTTLVFAVAPALALSGAEPHRMMGNESRSATSGADRLRWRNALVSAQVALAVIVVIGAGLTLRSFGELTAVDPGFNADRVLIAGLTLPSGDYAESGDVIRAYENLVVGLANLPGARSAAAVSTLPLGGGASNIDFRIDGIPPPAPGEPATSGDLIVADPGYAATLGIQVIEGRFFQAEDRVTGMPVTVVNRRLARMFWPDENAVGKRIRIAQDSDSPWLTIVGVIDDVQFRTLSDDVRPAWYLPLAQMALTLGQPARSFTVAIRTAGEPTALAPAVREVVRAIDPTLPVIRMRPLDHVVAESVATPRFTMAVLGLFAALSLVLGAIGIYGVLSHAVARRTREFGIRTALGAGRRQITTIVLGPAVRIVLAGLAIGLGSALLATKLMHGLLFGVSATDAGTYAGVAVVVCIVGFAACVLPLWRALTADPARALRAD